MDSSYKMEQEIKNHEKVYELVREMPYFMNDYVSFCFGTKNAAPRTVAAYMHDHVTFFTFLSSSLLNKPIKDITEKDVASLSVMDIQKYMAYLVSYTKDGVRHRNDAPARSRKLSSLRGLYKWMLSVGKAQSNPALLVPNPKAEKKNIIRLEKKEVKEVMRGVKSGDTLTEHSKKVTEHQRYRDTAIITLLLHTGIRVSECVGINVSDINWQNGSIRIDRKGRKEDIVYLNDTAYQALSDYMDHEWEESETDPDAFFLSRKGSRMSVRSMERVVKKYTLPVSPLKPKLSPHKLRATYATELYRQTSDINQVGVSLGHSGLGSVQKYVSSDGLTKRSAKDIEKAYR